FDPANHQRHSRDYNGRKRQYYAMPYGEFYIWGATAGMLMNLYRRAHDLL
ncbi:MAG: coenzyme A pyrophosphatase, partial [Alphaproteobacteria bacterium]